jgi:anti-sigma B factor antagonist
MRMVVHSPHGTMTPTRDTTPPSPEAAARLKTEVKQEDGRADIAFRGELDLATVPIAERAVDKVDGGASTLVLDLRKLSFIDSSGLRLILTTAEKWEGESRRLFIARGPAQVERVFELTGAGARLNLIEDPALIKGA